MNGLKITRVNITILIVNWTAPSVANGVIQYYIITVNKEGDDLLIEYNTTTFGETSYTLNGLGKYTIFSIK